MLFARFEFPPSSKTGIFVGGRQTKLHIYLNIECGTTFFHATVHILIMMKILALLNV
jgi:hypothetical protein